MRLSFVVPAFNEERYLGDCLRSIQRELAGREHLAEILVVNNASTDRTCDVARACGVRVVDEQRKGLPYARQAGFLASRGDLIANVDADSRLPAGWVDRVLAEFDANERLAAVSGPLVYYDLTPRQRSAVRIFYATAWLTYVVNRYILGVGSMVQGGNFVVARAALSRIGGFDTSITFYGEDTDIARRLQPVGDVRFTFDLKMLSSARRLKHEGMFATAGRYAVNYLWTIFMKRPFTREHADIREATEAG